jgi:hypothetical protein
MVDSRARQDPRTVQHPSQKRLVGALGRPQFQQCSGAASWDPLRTGGCRRVLASRSSALAAGRSCCGHHARETGMVGGLGGGAAAADI